MALTLIVTDAGRAALVNAANTGTAPVTIARVGVSGSAVVPSKTATALPGEIKRIAALSGDVIADDTIHLVVRDESDGVYTLRSLALYLADGTLFAIYGQSDVILQKSSQALMLLAIDVQFADVDARQLTFGDTNFLNPPATTERQGVVELATAAEARAGVDALRALTPAGAKAAILGWLLAQDGAGSGIDADLLDGQQGSYYSDVPARLGYKPVQQGTGAGQGSNSVKIGWSGERLKGTIDNWDLGNFVFDGQVANVWRSSNDGSGSGLDADLLDGQHGSYYSDIAARLGYKPVQQGTGVGQGSNSVKIGWSGERLKGTIDNWDLGNFVFDGQVANVWRSSNDGSGSGLDADLLDGQQGSYYSNIPARLGFEPVQQGTGTGQRSNTIKIGWSGSRLKGMVDALDLGEFIFENQVANVWRSSNDGSGSGLDADLLDGLQADAFLRDLGRSLESNGYLRLSNGLILQWGTVSGIWSANIDMAATFPIAFPERTLSLVGGNGDVRAQRDAVVGFNFNPWPTRTGFRYRTNTAGENRLNWFAIGI